MRRTIVCLANSYKHGGRCVAGICLETNRWIRLRGRAEDGALCPEEYTLTNGAGELRLLDVFAAEVHYQLPSECHPEDWVIANVPWELLERSCSPATWKRVTALEAGGPHLLGGYRDRVAGKELERRPMKESLALVQPDDLWWWIREDKGKRKNRALFHRNHVAYDLSVTDPQWLALLNQLPTGIYPHRTLSPAADTAWLTISLSEAFHPAPRSPGWHFRLVAAVMQRPSR